jgi:DNA-binding SARP family transcriptional activator/predicted ATPase
MTRLSIAVLGGLNIRLVGADTPLDLPTRKSKAFLAYLALSPGMLRSREQLAAVFWDRSAEEQARASLRQTLTSVRKALSNAPSLFGANTDAVWLDTVAVDVDALLFAQLTEQASRESQEQAVALYRGELLAGFSLREEPFEQWMVAERSRFHECAVHALSELVGHYERADQCERAIAMAARVLALDPLLEWAHRALIRLYARTGRREAAVRQYQACLRVLNTELGIAPTEETQRLIARVRREATARSATLEAIEPMRADDPVTEPAREDPRTAYGAGSDPTELPAERKQLSVLCARIRDATHDPDPESALERVDPVLKAMVDAVQRFGGTVTHIRGDGVTALFGAPIAHEDHAVRACYAALAMRASIDALAAMPLDMRIGIHSGEAVVRTMHDGRLQYYDALGPVPQVANQIDAALVAGEIGVTADTARGAEGFVELSAQAVRPVAGGPPAAELFILHTKSALRLRWNARTARGLTRFVGRDAEMARLQALLERAAQGSGQVSAIVGEPGMGKSRLVHEFVNAGCVGGCTILETGTASHDTSATYLPLASLLRTWFGIGERDTQAEAADKLRRGVEAVDPALGAALPALAALLDLPSDDPQWSTASPPQKRKRTLDAITALVGRASDTRPLILVIEDLHWIDTGTQAVLDHLVDVIGAARVLLVVTHRPEYRHNWFGKSYFSQLRVDSLDAGSADLLLRTLLGDDGELAALRRQLIDRTGCRPLFLEESVRALAEAGVLAGRAGAYRAVRTIDTFEIPSTVHAVLASRIDRLPVAQKALLQMAAVIGQEFPVDLLQPISGVGAERLLELLADLQAAEFIYQTRVVPQLQYTFKHALTRRVAYASVLKERRRLVHVQLVEAIERLHAERLDEHVERLARHALAGQLRDKAIHYLFRSAGKAIQRSAYQQAIEYLDKGLESIGSLPHSPARLRLELDYQKVIGVTMMAAKGWAAKEVLDAYTRARALCEELEDETELFTVVRGEGQYQMIRGEPKIAMELGGQCVALAAGSNDPGVQIETHHLFWTNSFFMGEYAATQLHSTKGISLYQRERDHTLTFKYSGHDPGVCCRCFSALSNCLCGYPERSLALCDEALQLARQLDHPLTTALAYWARSFAHILRREPEAAKEWAVRELAVCEEYVLPLLQSQGTFQLGWAIAELGDLDEGIGLMREGIAAISATGAEMGLPYFIALLGEALGRAGQPEAGLAEIDRALCAANRRGARFQLSEMLRLKGELLAAHSHAAMAQAQACFREAIVTAQSQGASLPLLRAAISLARLGAENGDAANSRSVLEPACEAITQGDDLPDVRAARELLARLVER